MKLTYKKQKVIFLIKWFTDYFYRSIFHFLSENPNFEFIIITHEPDSDAPYRFKNSEGFTVIKFNQFSSYKDLLIYVINLEPDLLYNHGWNNKTYYKLAKHFYGKTPTIVGIDNPWESKTRQYVGLVYFRLFMRNVFSHAWVAGNSQFEFARRLGFSRNNILNDLYCANTSLFTKTYLSNIKKRQDSYPKKILFVGRYIEYKQPLLLAKVFTELNEENNTNGWCLEFIGAGPQLNALKEFESKTIIINNFVDPIDLPLKFNEAGVFCLPSKSEHWGLVVHEAAASGLPLLLSDTTFASDAFLINGFNGFTFDEKNRKELKSFLKKLFNMTDNSLFKMGNNSLVMSKRISHTSWSAYLKSVLVNQ